MTGLLRGGSFQSRLKNQLRQGPENPCAVLVFAINRFRRINSLLGYKAGDQALKEIARRIAAWLPEGAFAGRIGGDEFAVALPGFTHASARHSAESLLGIFSAPLCVLRHEFQISAGLGYTVAPFSGRSPGSLLRQACDALTRAKLCGGNAIECNIHPETKLPEMDFRLESALRGALHRGEVSLRYQPQVDRDGILSGLEALACWNSDELGRVDTETFIRLAEETGAIIEIGEWILSQACRQVALWRAAGHAAPRVAVNVSPQQFASPGFVDAVRRILGITGIGGESLELEITEGSILGNLEESAAHMSSLRRLGVRIAIDDFGVGYSPLAYLHRLPLDVVKVDRSFVHQIAEPSGSLPIVHTITVLAHHRGLQVVAEGVETEAQLDLVRAARCDLAQGFFIGAPMSAGEVSALMAKPEVLSLRARARSASNY
ncbi:MAG: bifunctional diguanylate cyclase/phosphodiesterase [Acidobacteria bacterium]|nr:bifunctional diguanylate cyclase/phosphodiesterase [Acidobacteriota bacterium]